MDIKDKIVIAKDFKDNPGARERADGPNSGEEFLEDVLKPKYLKAVSEKYILLIDLDGVWGFPSSFISGSFGVLSMERGSEEVLRHLQFKSDSNELRIDKIIREIKNPTPKK